jgi:hypothetical protein
LLGQLLTAHTLVVLGTCAFLVLATMGASALLLRQAQDRTVEATVAEVINGVVVESRESHGAILAAAEEYFGETGLEGFRFELLDRQGAIVAARGEVAGWAPGHDAVVPDGKARGNRFRFDGGDESEFVVLPQAALHFWILSQPIHGDLPYRLITFGGRCLSFHTRLPGLGTGPRAL